MGHLSNEDRYGESRDCRGRVANGHDGACIVGSHIDVIAVNSGKHSGHEHSAQSHQQNGQLAIASDQTNTDEAGSRKQRSWM